MGCYGTSFPTEYIIKAGIINAQFSTDLCHNLLEVSIVIYLIFLTNIEKLGCLCRFSHIREFTIVMLELGSFVIESGSSFILLIDQGMSYSFLGVYLV